MYVKGCFLLNDSRTLRVVERAFEFAPAFCPAASGLRRFHLCRYCEALKFTRTFLKRGLLISADRLDWK
jgi:hypothetical protein